MSLITVTVGLGAASGLAIDAVVIQGFNPGCFNPVVPILNQGCGCAPSPAVPDPCSIANRCEPNNCVLRSGDSMTGPLILSEDPQPESPPLQAATKAWVLSLLGTVPTGVSRMEIIPLLLTLGVNDDYAIVPLLNTTIIEFTVWVPNYNTGQPIYTKAEMQNAPNRQLRVAFTKGQISGGRADLVLVRSD